MVTKLKLITVAALLLGTTAFAQVQSARIVTIDLNRVFNEYYKTPVASAKLKDQAEQYNKEHEDLMATYRKLVDELSKLREDQDKPEYTAEVREQKKKAVNDKLTETQKGQRDIEEFRTTHRQMLDQQTQRMRQGILKEVRDIIQKESRDAGYSLVFDKSGNTANGEPSIIFSQEALDITEDILKILNKNKPADAPKTEAPKPADKKPADKK
ncbi:MAG: OmpH family outer membrane protein [Verrucomicrobiota bacterium]